MKDDKDSAVSRKLNEMSDRIGLAWPDYVGGTANMAVQALNAAINLLQLVNEQRRTEEPVSLRRALDSARETTTLAEGLNRLAREWGRTVDGLTVDLGKLWSAIAADLPPQSLAEVVAIDERLRDVRDASRRDPLAALDGLRESTRLMADLANRKPLTEVEMHQMSLAEVAAMLGTRTGEGDELDIDHLFDEPEDEIDIDIDIAFTLDSEPAEAA